MKSSLIARRKKASELKTQASGSEQFVTDREQDATPKPPEQVEVPRLAAKVKKAQPVAPEVAPPAAVGGTPPPPPPAPVSSGNSNPDINQMSSEALSVMMSALAGVKDNINDKAALAFISQISKTLADRPVEAAPVAAPKASSAEVDFGGLILAAEEEDDMGKNASGNGGAGFVEDQDTMEIKDDGGRTPEIAEAHALEDEAPAKLDRPKTDVPSKFAGINFRQEVDEIMKRLYAIDTIDAGLDEKDIQQGEASGMSPDAFVRWYGEKYDLTPVSNSPYGITGSKNAAEEAMKASTALKKVKKLQDDLKKLYLDSKEITSVNSTRAVRDAVEAIYLAYNKMGQAEKVLSKQDMQETAEDEAIKIKGKDKKGSDDFGGLYLAAAEDDDDPVCEGCGATHNNQHKGYVSELCKACEKKNKEKKDKPKDNKWQ